MVVLLLGAENDNLGHTASTGKQRTWEINNHAFKYHVI